jgi:aldehyde dehydrogenase
MNEDDDFFDKALEGFAMFALNQGEVCTCPSRALVHEKIYDRFMERAIKRVKAIRQGHPLDPKTMIGAQASSEQLEKILSYIDIGKQEGAKLLTGGARAQLAGDLADGFYMQPTVFEGNNKMRIFQEEIFGPVVSVTTFKDEDEALHRDVRLPLVQKNARGAPAMAGGASVSGRSSEINCCDVRSSIGSPLKRL